MWKGRGCRVVSIEIKKVRKEKLNRGWDWVNFKVDYKVIVIKIVKLDI